MNATGGVTEKAMTFEIVNMTTAYRVHIVSVDAMHDVWIGDYTTRRIAEHAAREFIARYM